jgi:hypothetical protein
MATRGPGWSFAGSFNATAVALCEYLFGAFPFMLTHWLFMKLYTDQCTTISDALFQPMLLSLRRNRRLFLVLSYEGLEHHSKLPRHQTLNLYFVV